MNSGFIKIYRKLREWEWYTDINVKCVFIHCLLLANHTEKQWQGVKIERGSFITSYAKLSLELNIPIQSIRTAIKKLKSTGEITIKSTNKYSIISIKNYEQYQESNMQSNNQLTNNQQAANKQLTTTNELKNDKNVKNVRNNNILSKDFKEIVDEIDNQDFKKAVLDFIDHRKKMKSPFTPRALKMVLTELNKLANDDATKIAILNQSIMMGWKGVFPLKSDNKFKSNKNKQGKTEPDWLNQHEQYRKSKKDDTNDVDPEQVKKLLESFN